MSLDSKITLQDAIAWITIERNAAHEISEDTERPADIREGKKNEVVGMDIALQFLSKVWDGTKNDVITRMINLYENNVVFNENGESRWLTAAEFIDQLELFRDKPYSGS